MTKYLLILLLSASTFVIFVNGKIPEYINICKATDPQLEECILKSILNLRGKLVEGIPELGVPRIDPLILAKLSLNLGPGFVAEGQKLAIRGGKNFEIKDLSVDIKGNAYTFVVSIPEVTADGIYDVEAKIASIPLKGRGPIHLTARSVTGRGTLYGKKVVRGGETFNWFPSMNMKFEIDDYDIKLDNLFDGDPTIGEVTNKLLNEEKTEVLAAMLPGLEKALVEHILLTANNICKHFTWDELFPES